MLDVIQMLDVIHMLDMIHMLDVIHMLTSTKRWKGTCGNMDYFVQCCTTTGFCHALYFANLKNKQKTYDTGHWQ